MDEDKEINYSDALRKEVVDLVIARLETLPSNVTISIGDDGSFNVEELIHHVKMGDEIGRKIIEMQLAYLRSLKNLPAEKDVAPHN